MFVERVADLSGRRTVASRMHSSDIVHGAKPFSAVDRQAHLKADALRNPEPMQIPELWCNVTALSLSVDHVEEKN